MTISLKHNYTAVGVEAGDGEVGKTAWNDEHVLTLATGKLLGRSTAGTGAAEEITVGSGLTLNAGELTATGVQNTFSTFSVAGQSDVVADSNADTLTLAAGSNITITTNASTDTITIASTGGGTPGGSDTQVQFNDGGAFGGDSAWTWNKTTNTMTLAGQAALTLQTLTDGANIAWDCSAGAKAKVTLGGNRTMSAVTNAVEGTSYTLWAIQDGTGGRTLAYTTSGAGSFDFGTEGTPVLSTTIGAADCLGFEAISIGGTLKLRFMGIKRGFA